MAEAQCDKRNSTTVASVKRFLEAFVPAMLGTINSNSLEVATILKDVQRVVKDQGIEGAERLSETIAIALQGNVDTLFEVDYDLFPPSVSFGSGENKVKVRPTAGGTDNPDAFGNVGVQIDFNPNGEGMKPKGRLTIGVDLDSEGNVRGASAGWRCEF